MEGMIGKELQGQIAPSFKYKDIFGGGKGETKKEALIILTESVFP